MKSFYNFLDLTIILFLKTMEDALYTSFESSPYKVGHKYNVIFTQFINSWISGVADASLQVLRYKIPHYRIEQLVM